MAYKNNLLEYYSGGSVPYRQGYQEGGEVPRFKSKKDFAKYYKDVMSTLKSDKEMGGDEYGISLYEGVDSSRVSLLDKMSEQFWQDNRKKLLDKTGFDAGYERSKNIFTGKYPVGKELKNLEEYYLDKKYGKGLQDSLNIYSEFNKGGSVGNNLLGMQRGGYTGGFGGGRVRANLARYRKIRDASEDVSRRAKQIKEKKSKSGLFGKILGKAAEWGTGALLAPVLGPGALIAAKAVGRGIGGYAGAKMGYGDKVGSGLGETKWLASDRKKLEKSEKGLEESFQGTGISQFVAGAKKGAGDWVKSQGADSIEDYLQAKTGIKRNPFETPNYMQGPDATMVQQTYEKALADPTSKTAVAEMGASIQPALDKTMASSKMGGWKINPEMEITKTGFKDYSLNPSMGGFNLPSMGSPTAATDPFQYAQSGFGAQEGQKGLLGGLSGLAEGQSNLLAQQPWAQEGFQFAQEPNHGQNLFNQVGNPLEWMINTTYAAPYAGGGMVREDNALIDMMYRR